MRDDFIHAGVVAADDELSRHHTLPVVGERELEDQASLQSRLIRLGASAVAKAQTLVRGETGGAGDRHHDGELRLNFEIPGMKLNTGSELGGALPERSHRDAQAGGFKQVWKSG